MRPDHCTRVCVVSSPLHPPATQALSAQQQQLATQSTLLEQQLSAAAGRRLEVVQQRADVLEVLGTFFGQLQQQRAAEGRDMAQAAAEVGEDGCEGGTDGACEI